MGEFDDGQEWQQLTDRIERAYEQLGLSQNPDATRKEFKPELETAYQRILDLASKYGKDTRDISRLYASCINPGFDDAERHGRHAFYAEKG
jgi:DnaJ-domain-containing protein 1